MKDQKNLPYHKQFIESTHQEIKEKPSPGSNRVINLLSSCALKDDNIETLHEHLNIAMMLELSTLPPYLCALYSIEAGDPNQENYTQTYGDNAEVSSIIRSVMMEEMLHLTLAGNVLNAVGGKAKINDTNYVPEYPTILPDSAGNFMVHLSKFDKDTLRTFLRIEQPTPARTAPKAEGYTTIGQFYNSILVLMVKLETNAKANGKTIFTGKIENQIDSKYYYGGGGETLIVSDLKSARNAINIILEQGEGSEHSIYDDDKEFGQITDLAHYFKFNEIYEEQRYAKCQKSPKEPPNGTKMKIMYDKVHNMGTDLKTKDFPTQELKNLSNDFNILYRELLDNLQDAFTGNKEQFIQAVGEMYKLKYKALELMRIPIPGKKVNAGPTFEFLTDSELSVLKK